ncbi:MAG TPA: hypothetical protein VHT97_11015 [Acidimicrobiales bacterium]|nr:hypothetical protein [Acidimicrobiales bacterium]
MEELDGEFATELPDRNLLVALSLLGIPLVGLDGITVNIAGPRFVA